ncbi:hypothetical protein U1Q18_017057 [Sarracenia purpurea var. burkii]
MDGGYSSTPQTPGGSRDAPEEDTVRGVEKMVPEDLWDDRQHCRCLLIDVAQHEPHSFTEELLICYAWFDRLLSYVGSPISSW